DGGSGSPKGSYSFLNKSDDKITRVLTVVPKEGTQVKAVSLREEMSTRLWGQERTRTCPVPRWNRQHSYTMERQSMRVEADLAYATTLDVITETETQRTP